jgi:hypothetical protein
MAIFRPYQAKTELSAALERGYWVEKYDMSEESRRNAQNCLTYLRIRYPWKKPDALMRPDRDF